MTDPTITTARADGRPQLVVVDGGEKLHVDTCWIARRAARASGWSRVDLGRSDDVARECATSSLRPCKKCKPISRLAWWEKYHR